ncbi:MAG: glycosyltransferase family 2 protein [Gammaproteobacteria bacterium]
MSFKPCAVIPVFNHHAGLERIVTALRGNGLPVILVDDGSDSATKQVLKHLVDTDPQVECLTLPQNRGKGVAAMTGMAQAGKRGFSHALNLDADGQHDLADIPALLLHAQRHPEHLISGVPRYDDTVPAVRFYGRYLTHLLVWLHTLSLQLRDSMCGFRVYPLFPSLELAKHARIGPRMDFDTDIMTRLYWAGTESLFLPTRVRYPADGISHFRLWRDNGRMAWLHLRLFFGMLPRIPRLLRRNFRRRRARHWTQIGERGSLAGLRFIGFLDRVFSRRFAEAVLYPITAYFFLTHTRARRASRDFLLAAGVPASLHHRFRHFMNFSVSILDKVAAWDDPARVQVEFPQCALLAQAIAEKRGVLLLSAHLGNLEVARALSKLVPGMRINALVYTRNAHKVNALLEATSDTYPLRLIRVDTIGPETALVLREKVLAGEVVVIVGDRTPAASGSPLTRVEFLGRPARFAVGPYILAHLLECPMYLFFCLREGRGYRMYLEPFAEHLHLPRHGRADAAADWAGRYARRLAHYATRFPLQWYNFYDFWADDTPPPPTLRHHHNKTQTNAQSGKLSV